MTAAQINEMLSPILGQPVWRPELLIKPADQESQVCFAIVEIDKIPVTSLWYKGPASHLHVFDFGTN